MLTRKELPQQQRNEIAMLVARGRIDPGTDAVQFLGDWIAAHPEDEYLIASQLTAIQRNVDARGKQNGTHPHFGLGMAAALFLRLWERGLLAKI